MTTIVVTLPAGKLRWRTLADSPGLTGDPHSVLVKYLRYPEKSWTQQTLAAALAISVHRVRKATKTLQSLGYLVFRNGETDGRGRTESFAFVADEAGAHPDVREWITEFWERDRAARGISARRRRAMPAITSVPIENDHLDTGSDQPKPDDLQTLKSHAEPRSTTGKCEKLYPQTPTVDRSADEGPLPQLPVSEAVAAGPPPGWKPGQSRMLRRLRSDGARVRDRVTRTVPAVVLESAAAIGLSVALGLTNLARLEMAGYLALCLRAGRDVEELGRELRAGHKSSKSVVNVMLWRARRWASEHDQAEVETVQAWASEQWALYSARRQKARKAA